MTKSNKNRNYVLYTLCMNYITGEFQWTPTYYTRGALIHRIAITEVNKGTLETESILDNLSVDMHETRCSYTVRKSGLSDITGEISYYRSYTRKYYICKINKNSLTHITYDDIKNDLELEIVKIIKYKEKRAKAIEARYKQRESKFREEPVPYTHKRVHRGCYRHPQLYRTKYTEECVEYKEFSKPKNRYKNLPVWDDRIRYTDKSWKTSCKIRKQWQKHVRKHVDTIDCNKRVYDLDYEIE